MESQSERRSFLLGITLNELMFLLFFLLLIISALLLNKKSEEIINKDKSLQDKQLELDENIKKQRLIEEQFKNHFKREMTEQELNETFKKLVDVESKSKEIEKLSKQNSQLLADKKKLLLIEEKYNQLEDALNEAGLDGDSESALKELLQTRRENIRVKENLTGQVKNLERKLKSIGGRGLDHKPCWAHSETGSTEYIFNVKIYEDILEITPAWPSYREQRGDLDDIPGLSSLVNKKILPSHFLGLTKPIYDMSKNEDCRHFVKIYDDISTTKKAYQDNLQIVEEHFYKKLCIRKGQCAPN